MKKYPVYYNENTYEVRWVETDSIWVDGEVIKVYHVTQKNFLGIKYKSYKHLCSLLEEEVNDAVVEIGVDKNSEDKYIAQARIAVYYAEKKIKEQLLEKKQKEKLKSWDGVVEFEETTVSE